MSGWIDMILDYKIFSVAGNYVKKKIISIFAKRQIMKRKQYLLTGYFYTLG